MSGIVNCPGVNSETAGRENACSGCPNQNICTNKTGQLDTNADDQVKNRLNSVKHKVIILSGKGGVGKSTFTTLFAKTLATQFVKKNFAVLDLDICGPSQPRMFGVEDEQVHNSGSGWSPVNVDDNLCVMSIGFLLASQDEAVIWRGPKKNGMVRQFLSEVDWGNLDCLLIDTPPGTSDEHLSAISYLKATEGKIGAIIITTPQEISLLDVRKEITFCRKSGIPIIGIVENMSKFECKHCGKASAIFPAKTGGAERLCKDMNVKYLGDLPLDPIIAKNCDEGENVLTLTMSTQNTLNLISSAIFDDFM